MGLSIIPHLLDFFLRKTKFKQFCVVDIIINVSNVLSFFLKQTLLIPLKYLFCSLSLISMSSSRIYLYLYPEIKRVKVSCTLHCGYHTFSPYYYYKINKAVKRTWLILIISTIIKKWNEPFLFQRIKQRDIIGLQAVSITY